jgi:diguanylate cyclase (GGDEF)-like protein
MAYEHSEFRYAYVNRSASLFSGVTEADLGKTFSEFYAYHPDMAQYLHSKYMKVITERKSVRFDDGYLMPNGNLSGESIISPIYNQAGEIVYVVCVTRDFTAFKENEKRLRNYAYTDELTKLLNRRFLYEFVKQPASMYLLDLDHFKNINDTLGHEAGDQLLIEVAARLKTCFGSEYILIRLGGDEFLVISSWPETEPNMTAGRILSALSEPFVVHERRLHVSASIGIALSRNRNDISTLLRKADIALYHAKACGRKQYHLFDEELTYEQIKKYDYELALSSCIEHNELGLVYQPVYDFECGKVTTLEALLRWNKGHCHWVAPPEFIPIAEESGLITVIGEWVIRRVCGDLPFIQEKYGQKVKIAVNISRVQLADSDFPAKINGILNELQISPSSLILEVTETVVMHNIDDVRSILAELRKQGYTISLDDFGTGYSSLSAITNLPIDILKFDKSFIEQLNPSVISALLAMAAALQFDVIAEGVEDRNQLDLLRQLGCSKIQGYYLSQPVPLAQLPALVESELE